MFLVAALGYTLGARLRKDRALIRYDVNRVKAMKPVNFGRLDSGAPADGKAAIVFVHGFTGDWKRTWGNIPKLVAQDGALAEWAQFGFGYSSRRRFDLLGLWSADAAIPEIATALYTRLRAEVPAQRYPGIALVAHSMGGLVAQEALTQHPDLRAQTSHLILFGTPSRGLAKAGKLAFAKQQIENMKEDGAFIKALRERWTQLQFDGDPKLRFFTVAGELDQFVPPASSLGPFPSEVRRVVPGNHVTMLDVDSADDLAVKVLIEALTGKAAAAGPRNSARVAAEMGEFAQLVNRLWPGGSPMPEGLDDAGAVDLGIALEKVGRTDDAIAVLQAHKPQGTDPQGVLAGRLKRRWLVTHSEDNYQRALALYREGFERSKSETGFNPDQAYYHGINLVFLELAHATDYGEAIERAKTLAGDVLRYCEQAVDPHMKMWQLATEGDALAVLGKWQEALEKHRQAAQLVEKPWQALSMEEQAVRLARLAGIPEAEVKKLGDIYEGPES